MIAGLSFLQAILTPSLDKLSGSVVTKMIAAIPGIGRGAEGTIELVMSAAMVIKNGMGILLSLLLLLLCAAPIFELFVYSACLKLAAALTGIVSDKRITKICERAGETGFLLMTVVAGGMALFLFTMAVTCAAAR